MPLLSKVFLGALAIVITTALLFSYWLPGQGTTTIVAITALLVTAGKTAYDIIEKDWERKRKAEENREKIIVSPKYGIWDTTSPNLGVEIYNAGPNPVSIESVNIHYIPPGGAEVITKSLTNMQYMHTDLVESKHRGKFFMDSFEIDPVQVLGNLPAKHVWIAVKTHEGQEERVDGKQILLALKSPPTSQHIEKPRRTL
jgi:hypothetical protein